MSAIAELESDLRWREAEIAVIKLLLSDTSIGEREKLVLYRAGWALLYAHYEGFCKLALTIFFDQIKLKNVTVRSLPLEMQIFALSSQLKSIKNLPTPELMSKVVTFENDHLDCNPNFPEVETDSNLWPDKLKYLLKCADIGLDSLLQHERKIYTLVNRRNGIAHGEKELIPDYDYFEQYQNAVSSILFELAIKIDDRLKIISP